MLDKKFCELLEYCIFNAFANSENEQLRHFWCDGVLLPSFENEYSQKTVNDTRKVILMAFIGLTGQDKYELTLNFGNKALSRYAKKLDISKCLTDLENYKNLFIDVVKRKLSVHLN